MGTSPARASCGSAPTPFIAEDLPPTLPPPRQGCSQPPLAPCGMCGEVPPGSWQVPVPIGASLSQPCPICPRQSAAVPPAPWAPRDCLLLLSLPSQTCPSVGKWFKQVVLFSLCPSSAFPHSEVFYAHSESVLCDCDKLVGTDGQMGNSVLILAVWHGGRGSLCCPLTVWRGLGSQERWALGRACARGLGAA